MALYVWVGLGWDLEGAWEVFYLWVLFISLWSYDSYCLYCGPIIPLRSLVGFATWPCPALFRNDLAGILALRCWPTPSPAQDHSTSGFRNVATRFK